MQTVESRRRANKKWIAKHPEKAAEYRNRYELKVNYKERRRVVDKVRILRKYGLTLESFNELLIGQENRCGVCMREFIMDHYNKLFPNVDHNHNTGRVRGLLCGPCNTAIGLLQDNSAVLDLAWLYLKVGPYSLTPRQIQDRLRSLNIT